MWVMNLTPQQLQSATDTEHWHTTLHSAAEFGGESALTQVTQAGDRVFTPRQQDGMVAIETFTTPHGHHGHPWFMDQWIELVEIAGVRINNECEVDLLHVR